MKNLKVTLLAIALGFLSNAGAIGEILSQHDPVDGPIGIESEFRSAAAPMMIADAGVLAEERIVEAGSLAAPTDHKTSAARRDAIYKAAMSYCDTFPVAAQPRCLVQMKTSFGRP